MTAGALLLASGSAPCQNNRDCYRVVSMAAFTLAHLSDPHLAPLPAPTLRELIGKRATGCLHGTRTRPKIPRREVLDPLVADLRAHRPDHIAVTGDLVNIALEAEFAPA